MQNKNGMVKKDTPEPKYLIKVLDKSLTILETIAREDSSLGIAELSSRLKIGASTVHRILDTLKYRGYVEQDPVTRKYELGNKALELGLAKLQKMYLVKEAAPYLRELMNKCQETVHLAILDDGEVLYLDKEEPLQTIRMVSQIGRRAPAHCTGLGKVLLAHLDERERRKIVEKKGLKRFTQRTITDKSLLEEELNKIRKQGFAEDRGEHERDVRCVDAPLRDYEGKVIAAISISGPAFRMNSSRCEKLKELLMETTKKISRRLGYLQGVKNSKQEVMRTYKN